MKSCWQLIVAIAWVTAWDASAGAAPSSQQAAPGSAPTTEQIEFFEARIRPVLATQCYGCHNSTGTNEGGLALDYRGGVAAGGNSGTVIDLDRPLASRLLLAIQHTGDLRMPQDGPRLSPAVIADFIRWIEDGAVDPRADPPTAAEVAALTSWEATLAERKKWWSFQPIQRAPLPDVDDSSWSSHPVDRFVLARAEAAGLHPSPDADRRTLVRRLSFALTGLPPTVNEVEQFADDASPDAFEQLVDRLLASPHFGERWARHWMDWFRYADSHGSEGDPRIPNAWRYRDYLIRALNRDVPFDQLMREHIAGDLLTQPRINTDLEIVESSLGVGHFRFVEHGYSPTDCREELLRNTENQIDVLTKAFLGLTVSCARCHDHKFDPISQADFYALYGVFTSCQPAEITIDAPQRQTRHVDELIDLKDRLRKVLAEAWLVAAERFADELAVAPRSEELPDDDSKSARQSWTTWERAVYEAVDEGPRNPLHAWTRLQEVGVDDFPAAWASLVENWEDSRRRLADQRRRPYQRRWDLTGPDAQQWRAHGNGIRGAAPPGDFSVSTEGPLIVRNIYPGGIYSHLLSSKHSALLNSPKFEIEGDEIWVRVLGRQGRVRFVMNHYPRTVGPTFRQNVLEGDQFEWVHWDMRYWRGDPVQIELAAARDIPVEEINEDRSWFGVTEALVLREGDRPPEIHAAEFNSPLFEAAAAEPPKSDAALARLYGQAVAAAVVAWRDQTITDAQANFLSYFVRAGLLPNTAATAPAAAPLWDRYRSLEGAVEPPRRAPGVVEGDAADQRLFVRGDYRQLGPIVPRRFLEAIDPAPLNSEGSGRLELAERFAAPSNPLPARVMVNRIWQHLFGRGIVATPDNFGRLGAEPTHPELLDYLAARFADEGYSIKGLVRLLVTSKTYRQTAARNPRASRLDPENRWLSHMRVRRLEAEAIRDAMLAASGQLDRQQSGPVVGHDSHRRAVYIQVFRNALDPFLAVFDAPPPFTTKGRREVTNVPGQSLTMMNDPFVIQAAQKLAERITGDPELDDRQRVDLLFQRTLGRLPTAVERRRTVEYVESLRSAGHPIPWAEAAQAVFAFKEFIYIP